MGALPSFKRGLPVRNRMRGGFRRGLLAESYGAGTHGSNVLATGQIVGSSAGFARATEFEFMGKASEGAAEAPSDSKACSSNG